MPRPADQDLAVVGDPHLGAGQRQPDRAELAVVRPVDEAAAPRLGQPVAFEDQHARRVEELGDVLVERRRAGDEVADPAAEPLPHLANTSRSASPYFRPTCSGIAAPRRRALLTRCPSSMAQAKMRALTPPSRAPWTPRVVDLLEDARHGGHDRRLDAPRLSTIWSRRPSIAVATPMSIIADLQHLAERVRQRQPEELQVVFGDQLDLADRVGGVRPVVVGQLHALGPAGGARRVDERGQVVRADGVDHRVVLGLGVA